MFTAWMALITGLLIFSALLRVFSRIVIRVDLPWGKAFGISALVGLVYRGLLLVIGQFTQRDVPPPVPVFIGVVIITLASVATLIGWLARDEAGRSVGFRKGATVSAMLALFFGLLAAILIFTNAGK
jgi:hypothetical protein